MAKLEIATVRGMPDSLGGACAVHRQIVDVLAGLAPLYAVQEVRTPLVEPLETFSRTLGQTSDIVAKEMYAFQDRNDTWLTLRPEGTAGIVRAVLANAWQPPLRLWYHGAMFRYERPQKGRQRQFHQVGVEYVGMDSAEADVEVLALAWQFLQALGINGVQLQINTLGSAESRSQYRDTLVAYLQQHEAHLSEDSQRRLQQNPLRILDSKDAGDQAILTNAPLLPDCLLPEDSARFTAVCAGLDALAIPYCHNPRLVRGLDYYSHTAFEYVADGLGAQATVLAGGRYDQLATQFGASPLPSIGWAAGMERLALLLGEPDLPPAKVAIIAMAPEQTRLCQQVAAACRAVGIAVQQFYGGQAGKLLKKAVTAGIPHAILIGETEQQAGTVQLKTFATSEQQQLTLAAAINVLR